MFAIIAKLLVIMGSLLIGFGIGVIAGWQAQWKDYVYWIFLSAALVLGGFLLAWGIIEGREKEIKKIKKMDKEEEIEEENSKDL